MPAIRKRVLIDFNQERKAVLWTQNPESAGQQVSRSAGQQVSKIKKQQIRRAGLTAILGDDA
ncbi:hypothetical protein A8L51_08545 [Pantoea stewartii]|nr:hypothetical protein [Pantoea stewartii]